jgi:hypothetical protein
VRLETLAGHSIAGAVVDKALILNEIKRTAAANGGQPLGRQRFFRETGIRTSDWLGIYWARWGDAIREAGFLPNQLSQALEKNHLLECLAQLTIELDRLPTDAEMRLKRRRDPSFPSQGAFARLGDKVQLVSELHKYCDGRAGYQGVLRWCESYAPPRRAAAGAERSSGVIGRVYLLKSGRFHKIGRTNAAGRREYELAIRLPEPATTVHVISTDDPVGIEEYWHKRFQAKRKNGEWFRLDRADVAAFKRRRFM